MAVELRTHKLHEIVKKRNKGVAVLDQETRWGSTFQMVEHLIRLKDVIKEIYDCGNQKLKVEPYQWTQMIGLRDLLKRAYDYTIKLQYSDITPGYFYRKWTGLQMVYEDHSSILGAEIAKSMKKREDHLFNDQLLAAVFLDIHNQNLLTDEQKDKTRESVINVALRQQGINIDEENEETNDEREDDIIAENIDSDSDEEMSQLRKSKRRTAGSDVF